MIPEPLKYNSLSAYLFAFIRGTSLYGTSKRVIGYARRFLLVTRIIKILNTVLAIIETGTVLIVFAAVLIILIPAAILMFAVISVADVIIGSRLMKSPEFANFMKRERIAVMFGAGSFGKGYARQLAGEGYAVFVVTGNPKQGFVTYKSEGGVFYIRHAFFYRLKRRYFDKNKRKLIYLF